MREWLIRKPVKREVAEMESQQGSTACDGNNKRKIDENESANFQLSNRRKVIRKYDIDYLKFGFTWNGDHKDPRPLCVICCKILANESMRPNKLLRYIETKHMDLKSKPLQFFESKLKELNAYTILRITQSGQPHTIGESLVLPSIKDAVGVLFGDTYLKEIELIPLSNDTVARRIKDMAKWVEDQLNRFKGSKFFPCSWIRPQIYKGTSKEIFETLDAYVKSKELDWKNCVGICTDGAREMCGKNSGVVTRVLKQSPNASWTHCSTHREALVSKTISDDLKNVLNTAVKTLATFIVEKEATLDEDLISMIVAHLDSLKESFDYYFSEEMKFCDKNIWIVNPFQSDVVATGISTKADEELIDLSEDYSFKMSFDRKRLIQFWLSVQNTYPTLSTAALKVLLSFTTSYMCEIGFSAMIGIKIKLRNKLQLSNNLRLKLTHISVDVEEVISQNRKQAHCSHTPQYASH
ncbi:hAT family dimerization domain protein [Trichinella spiralis]|uniref:hAT family dimerization domain protein n=1 Tax=Trichinella spiralis TaxID=6334 RepID=UPI0001EFC85C|nr:hAT family dimerization domain protein [Trichinella spiralis]